MVWPTEARKRRRREEEEEEEENEEEEREREGAKPRASGRSGMLLSTPSSYRHLYSLYQPICNSFFSFFYFCRSKVGE